GRARPGGGGAGGGGGGGAGGGDGGRFGGGLERGGRFVCLLRERRLGDDGEGEGGEGEARREGRGERSGDDGGAVGVGPAEGVSLRDVPPGAPCGRGGHS
ncbi:MAG: hypothetical protein EA398_14640, partial [Deltaproteobacteria bacterium]